MTRPPPEFDPDDPAWADLLWSAARRRDDHSVAVVAAHCREHGAEPVLRWLADGPGTYRWLAGRLLVEGVPADETHTAAFVTSLAHSLRGDLTMTYLAATDFLDLAARARIPAVPELLRAAVRDAAWDWPNLGPLIATALATHDPEAATRVARQVLDDPDADGSVRASAAGVLAKADERHVAEAVDIVRAAAVADRRAHRWHAKEVLVDLAPLLTEDVVGEVAEMVREVRDTPIPGTYVAAARQLIRLGPRYAAEAVGMLRCLPTGVDEDEDGRGRPEAAEGLLEVDPPHTDEAIALLRAVLADPYAHLVDRLNAATTLGGLGSRYEDEATNAVRAVARSARDTSPVRVAAATALAGLGRRHAAEAARILRAVLAASARPDFDAGAELPVFGSGWPDPMRRPDTGAAAELAALGPPHTGEAVETLRTMIDPADVDRCVDAARELAGVGPRYVGAATDALRLVLALPVLETDARARVGRALSELDEPAAVVRPVSADPLRELARDHPRRTADALRVALYAAVTQQSSVERGPILGAVRDLVRLSADHTADAVGILRAVITNPVDTSERITAAAMLAEVDPEVVPEVVELLAALVPDPGNGRHALGTLVHLGRDHRGEVADALRQPLADPRLDAYTRVRATLDLAELGQRHDADITAALGAVTAHPDTDEPYLLMSSLRDLARNQPGHAANAATALVAVTRTATSPSTRIHGANILSQLDPQHTSDAADVLRSVLADPAAAPPTVLSAASTLVTFGAEHVAEALRAFHAVAADPGAQPRERFLATRMIKVFTPNRSTRA